MSRITVTQEKTKPRFDGDEYHALTVAQEMAAAQDAYCSAYSPDEPHSFRLVDINNRAEQWQVTPWGVRFAERDEQYELPLVRRRNFSEGRPRVDVALLRIKESGEVDLHETLYTVSPGKDAWDPRSDFWGAPFELAAVKSAVAGWFGP